MTEEYNPEEIHKVLSKILSDLQYKCIYDFLNPTTYRAMDCSKNSDEWFFNIINKRVTLAIERGNPYFVDKNLTQEGIDHSAWLLMEAACFVVCWFYKTFRDKLENEN